MTTLLSCTTNQLHQTTPNEGTLLDTKLSTYQCVEETNISYMTQQDFTNNNCALPCNSHESDDYAMSFQFQYDRSVESVGTVPSPLIQYESIPTPQSVGQFSDTQSYSNLDVEQPLSVLSEKSVARISESSESSEEDRDYPPLPTISLSPVPGPQPKCSYEELYFPKHVSRNILSPSWSTGRKRSPKLTKKPKLDLYEEKIETFKLALSIPSPQMKQIANTDHEKEDWFGWGNNPEWRMSPKQPITQPMLGNMLKVNQTKTVQDFTKNIQQKSSGFRDIQPKIVRTVPLPKRSYEYSYPGKCDLNVSNNSWSNASPTIAPASVNVVKKETPSTSPHLPQIFEPSFYKQVERLKNTINATMRCEVCGKEYKRQVDFKKHMTIKHPNHRPTAKTQQSTSHSIQQPNTTATSNQQTNTHTYQKIAQPIVANQLSSLQVCVSKPQNDISGKNQQGTYSLVPSHNTNILMMTNQQPCQMVTDKALDSNQRQIQQSGAQMVGTQQTTSQMYGSTQQNCQFATQGHSTMQLQREQSIAMEQQSSQGVDNQQPISYQHQTSNYQLVNHQSFDNQQSTVLATPGEYYTPQIVVCQPNLQLSENTLLSMQIIATANQSNEYQKSDGPYHLVGN